MSSFIICIFIIYKKIRIFFLNTLFFKFLILFRLIEFKAFLIFHFYYLFHIFIFKISLVFKLLKHLRIDLFFITILNRLSQLSLLIFFIEFQALFTREKVWRLIPTHFNYNNIN